MKTPEDVHIFLLRKFGLNYNKVLREKVSELRGSPVPASVLSKTINGKEVYLPTRELIAQACNKPAAEIFTPEFDAHCGLTEKAETALRRAS